MKIFITGATGFIGKQVVNKLRNPEHTLLILSRDKKVEKSNGIQVVQGNLDNINSWQNQLLEFKPDLAIHLAWEGIPDHGANISQLNLEYGLNLITLLATAGCKHLVVTGTVAEYGSQTGKLTEDTPIIPFDAFTAAKNCLHWIGKEIAREHNMILTWARLFYVYGPGQRPQSLIPYLISCIYEKKTPELRNPAAQNDFIYVDDVAEALVELLFKANHSDVYNIGSGELTKVSDIMDYIFTKLETKRNFNKIGEISKDALSYSYADISKIKKEFGWKPKVNISEGIDRTIDSFLKSIN